MAEPITVILNPSAGKGKSGRVWMRAKERLDRSGQQYEFRVTSRRGEASAMASEASTRRVVAVGGDGTLQEVANGLIGTEKLMGIIPAGSGNDLIKSLGIPSAAEPAVDIILAGTTRRIDAGRVACSAKHDANADDPGGRYFVNGVGVGFDAAVAARTQQIPRLTGTALYLAAVFQTLGSYQSPLFRVMMNGDVLESRHLLVAIGNGRCAGGGFFLTPEATVDDGLLDVCLIGEARVPRILTLMPRAMSGRHGSAREVSFARTEEIRLSAEDGFYVHADGEIVGRNVRSVAVRIIPGALGVLAPGGGV